MKPWEVRRLTPKEFHILLEEAKEMKFDDAEMMSLQAILVRSAINSKKKQLQPSDFIKRTNEEKQQEKFETMQEEFERDQAWLSSLVVPGKGG